MSAPARVGSDLVRRLAALSVLLLVLAAFTLQQAAQGQLFRAAALDLIALCTGLLAIWPRLRWLAPLVGPALAAALLGQRSAQSRVGVVPIVLAATSVVLLALQAAGLPADDAVRRAWSRIVRGTAASGLRGGTPGDRPAQPRVPWSVQLRSRIAAHPVRTAAAVVFALVLVAVTASTLADLDRTGHTLVGDEARTAVDALDVPTHWPRTGVPTTASEFVGFRIDNPGPLHLWSMSPFVRALGTDMGAWLWAAAAGLGALALGGWAAYRQRGMATALLTIIVMTAMASAANPGGFTHSLNTEVVLLPVFCCAVLAWGVASGDSLLLPFLVAVSSFVVQTFVGDAPLVLPACAVAVAGLAWSGRGRVVPGRRRHVTIAVITGIVLWLPVLDDQFFGTGNLGKLLRFRPPGRGLSGAVDGWAASIDLTALASPRWGAAALGAPVGAVAVTVLLVVVIALVPVLREAARRAWPLMAVTAVTVLGVGAAAAATPRTDTTNYHFFGIVAARYLVVLTLVVIVVDALGAVADRRAPAGSPARQRLRVLRVGALGALGVVAVATISGTMAEDNTAGNRRQEMLAIHEIGPELTASLAKGTSYQVVGRGGSANNNVAQGLIAHLRSKGFQAKDELDSDGQFDRLLVVTDDRRTAGGTLLAGFRPRDATTSALDPDAFRTWARGAGTVELTPSGDENLVDRIDGSVRDVCPAAFREDPALLLDLPAPVVAQMFVGGDFARPQPSADQTDQLYRWAENRTFAVIETPPGGPWGERYRSRSPFLSRLRCAD